MKDIRIIPLIILTILISCILILFGCTAENRPEPENVDAVPKNSDEYYTNLRAYKNHLTRLHLAGMGLQDLQIWKLPCKTDGQESRTVWIL